MAGKKVDLLEPAELPARFGVIYLHTYAGESLATNEHFTRLLTQRQIACVCPPGGRCWWADRACSDFDPTTTPERFICETVAPFVRERWGLGPRGLGLLGVDMGGQGALRMGFKYPNDFPAIAAIAPSIEYHELYWTGTPIDEMYSSKEACRQDTAPMHIHPSQFPPHIFFAIDRTDPWKRGCERLHEKLLALGVGHECDLQTRAGGHVWSSFEALAVRAIEFLAAGLERESRRLL